MAKKSNQNLPKYMTTVYFGNPVWFEELSRWAKEQGFTHSEAIRECIRVTVKSEILDKLGENHVKAN